MAATAVVIVTASEDVASAVVFVTGDASDQLCVAVTGTRAFLPCHCHQLQHPSRTNS